MIDQHIYQRIVNASADKSIRVIGNDNLIFVGAYADINKVEILIRGDRCTLFIGAFSTAGGLSTRIYGDDVQYVIGEHCMLAGRVSIGAREAELKSKSTGSRLFSENISIGSHSWIAREATIMPGTLIGNDCVIGQQASVCGSFPPNVVIGGQPAKVLAESVTWGRKLDETLEEMQGSSHYAQRYLRPMSHLKSLIADQSQG